MKTNNFKKTEIILFILLCFLIIFSVKSVYSITPDDIDGDGYNSSIDCDDTNASVYLNLSGYFDFDGDNYTFSPQIVFCTNSSLPLGYMQNQTSIIDCNDTNASIYLNLSGFADFDIDTYTFGPQTNICTNGSLPLGYVLTQKAEDCNDNNFSINPNATEVLYNGIDDDCNSSTRDYIIFNITTSSDIYNIGDAVTFNIFSENQSNVNISLKFPNNYYTQAFSLFNQTYPISDSLDSTKKIGNYTIVGVENYKGFNVYKNKTITIANSISISLTGDDSVKEHESFDLIAKSTGGYGSTYNYTWYLEDGSKLTGNNIMYSPTLPGDYNIIVNAKDSEGNEKNQTFVVTVNKIYTAKLLVIDKSTEGPISNVNIDVGGYTLTTGSNGYVSFYDIRGRYDLTAYKDGYSLLQGTNYYMSGNSTWIIRMSAIDNSAPIITLFNKTSVLVNNLITVDFSVVDSTKTSCSLYVSTDSNWWNLKASITDIINNQNRRFTIYNLNSSDKKYRLECTDSEGNSALSEEGVINPAKSVSATTSADVSDFANILQLKDDFSEAKLNLANLGTKEQEVYSLLNLDLKLKDAERVSSGFERDLDAIQNPRCPGVYCNLDEVSRQKQINNLTSKTSSSIGSVPLEIKVISSDEFVRYPSKTDVESVLKSYYDSKGKVLTKSQLSNLVEKNFMLQSKMTISTKIYHATIKYLNGETNKITLIKKSIDLYDKENAIVNNKNYIVLEAIPNEASQNLKALFISESTSLKNNNLFEIPTADKQIIFTLNDDISSEKIKLTNTLLISTAPPQSNSIIGFSILSAGSFSDLNYTYLIIGLIIVIIIVRVLIIFGLFDGIKQKFFNSDDKEFHSMSMLINDAKDYLDAGDMQKASLIYKEIKLRYENISDKTRERVYSLILDLCSKIDETYVTKLVETANDDLAKKDKNHAVKVYLVLENVYKKLRDNSKLIFETEIKKIHSKLTGNI